MFVVALTSIPPRFAQLPRVIAALRRQRCPPHRIFLTIPRRYRRFPRTAHLPDLRCVDVVRPDHDDGPAAKILGPLAAQMPPNTDILYCDDDWLYGPDWAGEFLAERARLGPGIAIAASGFDVTRLGLEPSTERPRRDGAGSGFIDIAQGFGGVLVRPAMLSGAATPPNLAWAVDDIYLSAVLAKNDVPIWKQASLRRHGEPLDDPCNLQNTRIGGHNRATANRAAAQALRADWKIWCRNPA